jgi:hypothetical protein
MLHVKLEQCGSNAICSEVQFRATQHNISTHCYGGRHLGPHSVRVIPKSPYPGKLVKLMFLTGWRVELGGVQCDEYYGDWGSVGGG